MLLLFTNEALHIPATHTLSKQSHVYAHMHKTVLLHEVSENGADLTRSSMYLCSAKIEEASLSADINHAVICYRHTMHFFHKKMGEL